MKNIEALQEALDIIFPQVNRITEILSNHERLITKLDFPPPKEMGIPDKILLAQLVVNIYNKGKERDNGE